MKKSLLFSVFLLLALGFFSACSDDDKDAEKEYTLTVASVRPLSVFVPDFYNPDLFATYKHQGEDSWTLKSISNFDYEEGYEYVLRVKDERVHHGEIMDLPTHRTVLLELISKTKKEAENIPLQGGTLLIASQKTGDEAYPYYTANYNLAINPEKWIKTPKIEGFEYEEGYEYHIRVNVKYNGINTPSKIFLYI